jgi:hypothetical protein
MNVQVYLAFERFIANVTFEKLLWAVVCFLHMLTHTLTNYNKFDRTANNQKLHFWHAHVADVVVMFDWF